VFGPKPIKRMSDFRASWLGSGPAENHPTEPFGLRSGNGRNGAQPAGLSAGA
jgi:hypothetical protein